ncbi:hypothetical protein [Kangiella sp. M94]
MTHFSEKKTAEALSNEIVSDEKLSAFLDSELPEKEMAMIRDLMAADKTLVNRIAELASVDAIVSSTYHQIDEVPLPQSIQQLLDGSAARQSAEARPKTSTNVVNFPLWQRIKSGWQNHAPLATAAALIIGLSIGLTSRMADFNNPTQWATIASALDQEISGQPITLAEGYTLLPRVSFTNANEQFCRQFVLNTPANSQHSIACHDSTGWQLTATLFEEPIQANSYQTASANQPINKLVESMAVGSFLDKEQEQQAIRSGWAH